MCWQYCWRQFVATSVTVPVFVFSFTKKKKKTSILPDIESKNLRSRVPHNKLGVAQQVIIFYGS